MGGHPLGSVNKQRIISLFLCFFNASKTFLKQNERQFLASHMSFPYNNPATDFRERTHMNNIINLLNLENKNIEISKIERDYNAKIKYIHVCTKTSARFCPICNMRMH